MLPSRHSFTLLALSEVEGRLLPKGSAVELTGKVKARFGENRPGSFF